MSLPPKDVWQQESQEFVRSLRRKLIWNDLKFSFREAPGQTLFFFFAMSLLVVVGAAILYDMESMGGSSVFILAIPFYLLSMYQSVVLSITGTMGLFATNEIQGPHTPRDIRGPYFQLAPLDMSAVFRETLSLFLRWLVLFSVLLFVLFFSLVWAGRLSLLSCLLFTLLWLKVQLLAEIRDLGLAVSRRCFGKWEDPEFKVFGWWPALLTLAFPVLVGTGVSFLLPLVILLLLLPLDRKAYRIWQEHVLPNSGSHQLWYGPLPEGYVREPEERPEFPGEEEVSTASEKKPTGHPSRLTGTGLGWEVIQELLDQEKQDWKGVVSIFVIGYFVMLVATLPLFLFLAWEGGHSADYGEVLTLIPWAIAVLLFLIGLFVMFVDGIDSHFVVRSAGSLNKGALSCTSDWVHLLPLLGSLLRGKCLRWLARHFLKVASPLLVLIPASFALGYIGEGLILSLVLAGLSLLALLMALNVFFGYRDPKRRRWKA